MRPVGSSLPSGDARDRIQVSDATAAENRDGGAKCSAYLRKGDTLVVYALDRLSRSTVDVLMQIGALVREACASSF